MESSKCSAGVERGAGVDVSVFRSRRYFRLLRSQLGVYGGQLRKFLLAGILNAAFGYFVYAVFVLAGVTPGIALFIATCVGIIFNFFTTGRWVFRNSDLWAFPPLRVGLFDRLCREFSVA